MPTTSVSTPTSDEMQARWQAFCRTKEFQEAAKWVADGDFPGALFVAFRAGAASAHPSCKQACVTQRVEGAIPAGSREALRQALRGTSSHVCRGRSQGCRAVPPAAPAAPVPPVVADVLAELAKAVATFPTWPTDPLHALAVLGEEFGELTKDVLQLCYEPHKTTPQSAHKEAMQTAAMALRFAMSLARYEYLPGAQHAQGHDQGVANG
jgi:hypothetical protein